MQLNTNLPKRNYTDIKSGPIFWEISRMLEITHLKSEFGSRKSEVGSRKSEVGSQKSEVRSRKSEVESRKSEVGSPSSAFVGAG